MTTNAVTIYIYIYIYYKMYRIYEILYKYIIYVIYNIGIENCAIFIMKDFHGKSEAAEEIEQPNHQIIRKLGSGHYQRNGDEGKNKKMSTSEE